LPSCGAPGSCNLDLVAEPADAQNLLSLTDSKGNRDQLGLAGQEHRRETHHGVLFGIYMVSTVVTTCQPSGSLTQ
jgi:hypothetical protein